MNTVELIKKISESNNMTFGRSEMILSIIFERLTEKLKKEGEVTINNFGNFTVVSKRPENSFETNIFVRNQIKFNPDKSFLDIVNS